MEIKRLEHDATNLEEVTIYYQTRARQLLFDGFFWDKTLIPVDGGYSTSFIKDGIIYKSFYVLKENRNKGYASKHIQCDEAIVTVSDCNIEDYLKYKSKDYVIAGSFNEFPEYKAVQDFYGDKKAERSQCYLMNHIDEGLYIMQATGASEAAMRAFCLHPLTQDDDSLKENWNYIHSYFDSKFVGLALEYRNIANAYLSKRTISSIDEIHLSPLKDVNDMLIGDKVQNYKDFLLYHAETHHRKDILDKYFKDWLQRLEISDSTFKSLVDKIKSIEI